MQTSEREKEEEEEQEQEQELAEEEEEEEEWRHEQFMVILLGDGTVGKTSLATRCTKNSFSQSYRQTIGVDFFL